MSTFRMLFAMCIAAACGRAASSTTTPSNAPAAAAGTGGYVATLGADTVHVERFVRSVGRIEGTVVTRTPAFRVLRWSLTYDDRGRPLRYDAETKDANGSVVAPTGSMTFAADTIVRQTLRNGQMETQRVPASVAAYPSPSIPYVGVSFLMYEAALADTRRRGDTLVYLLTMLPTQMAPQRTRAWIVGTDSAEISYFGVARSGYRFDASGNLVRADWRKTTYAYQVARVSTVDVDAAIRDWTVAEKNGRGFGALSPRDTVRAKVGVSDITLEYSRPSRRGREIWGTVVPWDKVWRLGADAATHMTTTTDLIIGETTVPAGRYTLWMFASPTQPRLIVNSAVNIFGTAYNPARDFAHIPLTKAATTPTPDRLTLRVNTGALEILWGDVTYSVPVRAK